MASIKDILNKEEENKGIIHLYREGLFFKAYHKSAFLFVKNILSYKIKKIYYKSLAKSICSIGFPKSVLEKKILPKTKGVEKELEILEGNKNYYKIKLLKDLSFKEDEFQEWYNSIEELKKEPAQGQKIPQGGMPQDVIEKLKIIDEIMMYPLETSTPIDAMTFISQIRKEIAEIEKRYK